jgi:hypothetical protein
MSADPRFICASDLQLYLVDKDTGGPLSGGEVAFYSDVNRNELKAVYQLSGSAPNYTFTPLDNPCTLSSVGTFQDEGGNDIVPYYFPYEGTPDDSNNEEERYYIVVTAAPVDGDPGVEQFTRENWPPNSLGDSFDGNDTINYIPNGQFLAHTQVVSSTQPPVTTVDGVDIQPIAQGGWSFRRTNGGTSTFNNRFVTLSGAISGSNDFSRNAFIYQCTSFDASDAIRDITIAWPDLYKFSAGDPPGTQPFTLFFEATSLDSGTYEVDIRMIQDFGTGGTPSSPIDISLGTVEIEPGSQNFRLDIDGFPATVGTFGTNGDDYVALALRGPESTAYYRVTSFALLPGTVSPAFFPTQTNANMLSEGVAGWMPTPNPDGSDLYLTLRLTPQGMTWDSSEIGEIIALTHQEDFDGEHHGDTNLLRAGGQAYVSSAYSPIGIPYSRLQGKWWDATSKLPKFGTGIDFATAYIPTGTTNILRISTNKSGPQTNTADGGIPTNFTFSTLWAGTSDYQQKAWISRSVPQFVSGIGTAVLVIDDEVGTVTAPDAGTSGLEVIEVVNSADGRSRFYVDTAGIATATLAGTYFTFSNTVPTNYYVWFTVDGAGADPAPGGTGILVPLLSTYAAKDNAALIRERLSGFHTTNITCGAAASITGGSYFVFRANGNAYNVWYRKAGVGTAPATGATNIMVDLTGSETADQVTTTTQEAINGYQFAVPNLAGVFLRGFDWSDAEDTFGDQELNQRFSMNSIYNDDDLGSFQPDGNLTHDHYLGFYWNSTPGASAQQLDVTWTEPYLPPAQPNKSYTEHTGDAEAKPFNLSVNYAIRY